MMTQVGARFSRQPAHALLLDISQPFNHDALLNVYQSVTDFLSLVTHIGGPSRVPLFGFTSTGQYAETIFPLQPLKGNFARLYSVVTEFKRSVMDTAIPTFEPDSFRQGFKDVLLQYQRQQQSFRQVSNMTCQLEISILTCQPSHVICAQVRKILETLDLNCLKKVQVLELKIPAENIQAELSSETPSPGNGSGHSNEALADIVDLVTLENDALCMMNYFKTWLKDCGTDCESIHLILPARINHSPDLLENDFNSSSSEMVLKCDLHEALIDPLTLLNGEYFNLRGEYSSLKSYSQSSKAANTTQCASKVYKLRGICLVKTTGVCESVLYGMPMFARPTCCWKLDWDELESNQQQFTALCKVLNEKNLSLVLRSETDDSITDTYPQAYYIVMASSNSTLLIKSIVMDELMLPSDFPNLADKTSQQSTEIIEDCLDRLPIQKVYNPFFMKSNLFKFFISKTLKNNPGSRGSKRKFQAPQRTQEQQSKSTNPSRNRNETTGRQIPKKTLFQSPRATNNPVASSRNTSAQKKSRILSTVAGLETKFYD